MYELTGRVKEVFDGQVFPSGFSKREFVVTTEENYPQDIKLECIKDRCELLTDVAVGDRVEVRFNLRGNEYRERYYVNLQAWRITKMEESAGSEAPVPEDTTDYSVEQPDDDPF